MQDMIPPEGRSIRDIPIPPNHRHQTPPPPPPKALAKERPPYDGDRPRRPRRRGRGRRILAWLIAVVILCAGAGAAISLVFAGVEVKVKPRTQQVKAPETLNAALNAPVGTLSFEIISVTRSATTTVPATGTARVSRQASGVVTITSTYSASQRLITNTRLEAPDGKIYRLGGPVTLPAGGSATATIYADSPGSDYNRSGATTFTLPGFKSDPRYTKFSAKSGGPISGGFVGEEPSVPKAALDEAKSKLQGQLDAQLRADASSQIPEGTVAIPGSLEVAFDAVTQRAGDSKTATLSQTATAKGAVVRVQDLATSIARKTVEGYGGEAVLFAQQNDFSLSLATTSKLSDEQLVFTLSGSPTLVWQFDPAALKEALIGKEKSSFEAIIKSFEPAIAKADASIRPFWTQSFPTDPEKIKVVIIP